MDRAKPGFFLYVFDVLAEFFGKEPRNPAFTGEGGTNRFNPFRELPRSRRAASPMAKKAAPKATESKPKAAEPVSKKAEPAKKADAASKKTEPKAAVRPKPATKNELYATLSEKTGLNKKDISTLFDVMYEEISGSLGKKGPGIFVIPGLVKFKVHHKPATKERQTFNPATREPMTSPAKPAHNVVKAVLLKSLKDLEV